ncbi:MAG: histidine--tRNA ligase [Fastidiosipilaceae bacterium]
MKITPVKGTNDFLPAETAVRDYLQNKILEVYQNNGFRRIMTPAIEDAVNLDKSEGGDNLNLIFKILKRGNKLEQALEDRRFDELADLGLRYDLTLPLSRYYAANRAKLMSPVKCVQIDKVYRAERPQKGRLREFMQCDIDIIGSSAIDCEIELILTTAKALRAIGLADFKVRVNDRRILRNMLQNLGFAEASLDSVSVTFDKLDKIGVVGVKEELSEKNMPAEAVERLATLLSQGDLPLEKMKEICDEIAPIERLQSIIGTCNELAAGAYEVVYDSSLVRGQGYYTGTVFEIESTKFRGSIAGGGRYDNLIGKFLGQNVPAVGFSIGFERIFSILMSEGFVIPDAKKSVAVLYEPQQFTIAWQKAEALRADYDVLLHEKPKNIGGFLDSLVADGYWGFLMIGKDDTVREFKK